MTVAEKIRIVYTDANHNEHATFEAACIAQALLDDPTIYLTSADLKRVAACIDKYLFPPEDEAAAVATSNSRAGAG